jgi:pentatricopeptide repeat protein
LKDSLQSAYETYCLARGRGVEVDINMVRQLIVDLCKLSPPRLSEAMELYNDLINAEANHANAPESRFIPTMILYKHLLPAAARTTPPAESVAISLLNDMRSRRLKFDATTLTSLTILLMRSSTSHQTAFRAYAHMYALDKQLLDRDAYAAIISAFINLSWPSSRLAPPNLFLEIVKDMRKAGFTPNAQVYTSLLHRYGANVQRRVDRLSSPDIPVPEAEPERWVVETLEAIQAIHTVIKLDPSVTIDVPLLNALMNAYNRVGAFAEAFEVWDELVERRAHEKPELYAASINVALDACGYSEAHVKAHRVWRWARRNNLTVDRNWDAWIECLARLGEMDEAVETVCGEMKRRENGAPAPTTETLRILLRFSWRSKDVYRQIKQRIEQEFPNMWNDVKDVVETSRHQ